MRKRPYNRERNVISVDFPLGYFVFAPLTARTCSGEFGGVAFIGYECEAYIHGLAHHLPGAFPCSRNIGAQSRRQHHAQGKNSQNKDFDPHNLSLLFTLFVS